MRAFRVGMSSKVDLRLCRAAPSRRDARLPLPKCTLRVVGDELFGVGAHLAGGLGPAGVVGVVFFGALLSAYTLSGSQGQHLSVLDSVATPSFARYFGAAAGMASQPSLMLTLATWVWALWLAHLVFIAIMERLRPDEAGLIAARQRAAR